MIRHIPLLLAIVIAYNAIAYLTGIGMTDPVLSPSLPSGTVWTLDVGHLLIACGLILLYFEILKATRTTGASIVDHVVSTLVFVVCLLEFILVDFAGTNTFFIITLMTAIDVIAGFTVTISTARRDLGIDRSLL